MAGFWTRSTGRCGRRCITLITVAGAVLALGSASAADAYVYWATGSNIARANMDGSNVRPAFITGASGPYGVAVDGAHVYWTNYGANAIGRANIDGSEVDQRFITGADGPHHLAVGNGYVYWTNNAGSNDATPRGSLTIGRAKLDGSKVDQSFITGVSTPTGIAVDYRYVYWGSHYPNAIGRANVDGSGVNERFITGAAGPQGVAVNNRYVFWSNFRVGGGGTTIGRANLDGSEPGQSFISGANYPIGIALDDSYVYWANRDFDAIGRAGQDGSGVDQRFITGANSPSGVAVDRLSGASTSPTAGQVVKLPSARGCTRARFKVRLTRRSPGLAKAVISVNGKRVKVVTRFEATTTVALRKLPKAPVSVTVVVTLKDSQVVQSERRYRSCSS